VTRIDVSNYYLHYLERHWYAPIFLSVTSKQLNEPNHRHVDNIKYIIYSITGTNNKRKTELIFWLLLYGTPTRIRSFCAILPGGEQKLKIADMTQYIQ
jgi:hypothetical protein